MWLDQGTGTAATPRGAASSRRMSPALQVFELNPFRLLRLASTVTTTEATFAAEHMLTLARADVPSDTPDPLPWLPQPDFPELQQAAQSVEEPLLRLRYQLLWFDFVLDPHGAALATALSERDSAAIATFLNLQPPVAANDEGADPALADSGSGSLIAHAINQANLRLLLAASQIDGFWRDDHQVARSPATIPDKDWRPLGNARTLPQAHLLAATPGAADDVQPLWQDALQRWTHLSSLPAFRSYVTDRIAAIDDDFAQAEDAEAIEQSIRVHLADLSAQQIRFLLIDNRYVRASGLVAAVAASGLELRVLTPAMRPIRQLLRADLAVLDPLLERADNEHAAPIEHYLRRLSIIRDRWLILDEAGIVGLREMIDEPLERVYLKLRQWDKPSETTDRLLGEALGLASAQSLRERVVSLQSRQRDLRERVCHYCDENEPDYDKCVVLNGKKETHRTQRGNTTTVHYLTTVRYVLRCARCARFHDYVRRIGLATTSLIIVMALVAIGLFFESWSSTPVPVYNPSDGSNYSMADNQTMTEGSEDVAAPPPLAPSNASDDAVLPQTNSASMTRDKLRTCLTLQMSINTKIAELQRIETSEADRYNRNVDAFNQKIQIFQNDCYNRKYDDSDRKVVEAELEGARAAIEAKARSEIQ